ncbi:TonB-dependent receptor [Methylopila jiangsuensis]|uniref:TonB-dependent receptor n=1 Tax=Methylopila jiangsuensis TaxID=586230 RepID=A0A9W6JJM5_9HYPH|nr:TonB-dependent receptor [Methylopila jiangsuensis]MDR6286369.1 iron complex outermembrane receptor protein [Methylopila jiangsuensis]GLK77294.1 TonB-dependent receptor [Methylopila jiangsuensis]
MSGSVSASRLRRSTPRSLRVALLGACCAAALASPSRAQSPESPVELDEITVSGKGGKPSSGPNLSVKTGAGSRLGLTPLETPASVDVVSGDVVRDRGQASIAEAVTQNAAGFSFIGTPGNGFGAYSSRGFTGVSSVTTLYDGVRLYPGNGTVTFPFDTWTVDRIEVLRGPASVLYGEGAIGGAINIIPKKPLYEERRNEARAVVGTDGQVGLAAGSAGPINEKFAYSFDVAASRGDGWMDRGDYKNLAFSGALNWRPTDELSVTLTHDGGHNQPSRYFGTPLKGSGNVEKDWIGENYNVRDGVIRFNDNITQLKAEWTPNETVTLRAVGYYVTANRLWRNAEGYKWNEGTERVDRSSFIAIKQEQEQIGARADATIRTELFGMANEAVVGFDVNRFDFRRLNNGGYRAPDLNPSLPPKGFDPGEYGSASSYGKDYKAITTQYSFFIDDRLKLTDQISLVAGLRYDHPEVDFRGYRLVNGALPRSKTVLDSLSWRVGAVYEPVKNLAVYAQYSEAADPVTSILSLPPGSSGYKLSKGRQVEAGVKQSLWDDRFEWTLSAFYIEKKDLLAPNPNKPGSPSEQIGKQSSRGVEASVGVELGHGWRVDANATILDARYDEFFGSGNVDYKGNTPNAVPETLANVWATWRFAEDWKAQAGLQYVGKTYTSASNDHKRPAYALVNAGLQWKPTAYATLDLRVKNLFDKTYAYTGGDSQWYFGAPRTAELALHLKF